MKKISISIVCFVMIFIFFVQIPVCAISSTDYIISNDELIETPLCYLPEQVISYLGEKGGNFIGASDLFIDKNDNIFITDKNRNRIVKLNPDGEFIKEYTNSGNLSGPSSVFVSDNGDIFIADSDNKRIVHINDNDEEIEVFGKPDSSLLDEDLDYTVTRFAISKQGIIYVIYAQHFMMIDANNDFKGFYASNKVPFKLSEFLIRTFGSEVQKNSTAFSQANSYNSLEIGEDGLIYAVSNDKSNQISVLNSNGENIFKFDEKPIKVVEDKSAMILEPQLIDICVDKLGNIYVLERNGSYIYLYDKEGTMLSMFGGRGSIKGKFSNPVAVDTNSKGETFVLDASNGTIHRFKPTSYMNKILEAHILFNEGKYEDSFNKWNEVLEINSNCSLANSGKGKILYKQEQYKEAMNYFKKANDKENYAKSFTRYRHSIFRDYFGWVVIGLAVLIGLIILTIIYLRKRSNNAVDDYYYGKMRKKI